MKPILYEKNTTVFTTNGLGRLADCISCVVTEERNGIYECEFEYPNDGLRFDEITEGRIISVTHDDNGDRQPFVIYRKAASMDDGVTVFNAHHVTYGLSTVVVKPFTATSVSQVFTKFTTQNMNTNPFTFWTDNDTAGTFEIKVPSSVRGVMGGVQGSILDIFGGEYEYDNFTVKNHAARGTNNGVIIRYGKNLMDLDQEIDTSGLYNSVVPFWADGEQKSVIYGSVVTGTGQTQGPVTPLDLSMEFTDKPTKQQLEARALTYLDSNTPWIPSKNITIDFIPLWQTDEYKDIARLEKVSLCDPVTVIYNQLGVQATAKVVKTEWNVLQERYNKIEIGRIAQSFGDVILSQAGEQVNESVQKHIAEIASSFEDTGWTDLTLTEDFTTYSTANPPVNVLRYRKIGKLVELNGVIKPTRAITGGGDSVTIGTLPTGYRPSSSVQAICQGSSRAVWLLVIGTGGGVTFSRYRDETGYVDTTNGTWLPIHAVFFID